MPHGDFRGDLGPNQNTCTFLPVGPVLVPGTAMAPKRASFRAGAAEDQIARLQERATLLQHKDELKYVVDTLKRHPSHVPKVKNMLENLMRGAIAGPSGSSSASSHQGRASRQEPRGQTGRSALADGDAAGALDQLDDDGEDAGLDAPPHPLVIRGRLALADEAAGYQGVVSDLLFAHLWSRQSVGLWRTEWGCCDVSPTLGEGSPWL